MTADSESMTRHMDAEQNGITCILLVGDDSEPTASEAGKLVAAHST